MLQTSLVCTILIAVTCTRQKAYRFCVFLRFNGNLSPGWEKEEILSPNKENMKRRLQLTSLSEPLPNTGKHQVETSILKNKCIIKSVDKIMCYNIETINKIKCHHQNHILVHFHHPQTKLQIYYWIIYCPQLQFLKIQ